MRKYLSILIVTSCFVFSCKEDNVNPEQNFSCEELTTALINNEEEKVRGFINQVLQNYEPLDNNKPDDKEQLEALVDHLNACENIEVTDYCYACLYSLPPQSYISLKTSRNNQTVTKELLLKHDLQNNLFFSVLY